MKYSLPIWDSDNGIINGTIVDSLPYCQKNCHKSSCANYYQQISTVEGFHLCPKGLVSYVIKKDAARIIYSSLRIKGHYKKGADDKLFRDDGSSAFTPAISEEFFARLVKNDEEISALYNQLDNNLLIYRELLHDVKKLNAHIKNKAEDIITLDENASEVAERTDIFETLQRIKNIEAMAGIIASRFDVFDLTVNPANMSRGEKRNRVIYKKFHKAKYMLTNYLGKHIAITFTGSSMFTYAVNQTFDTLPFILLENAVKYSPDSGEVQVVFREEHGNLYISIKSTGPYCSKEDIAHVFERGYRGKMAAKSPTSGSGFGLYIAQKICKEHNINIIANSNLTIKIGSVDYGEFTISLTFFGCKDLSDRRY